MKKLLIVMFLCLLLAGCKGENKNLKTYEKYINELKSISESSEDIPFLLKINVMNIKEDYISYTVLLDRNDLYMGDIEAILIHDKESENVYPSIGIYDDKITLDNESKELGIKLTGYLENYDDINFKFLIKYKDEEGKKKKYYYIYNYRQ